MRVAQARERVHDSEQLKNDLRNVWRVTLEPEPGHDLVVGYSTHQIVKFRSNTVILNTVV